MTWILFNFFVYICIFILWFFCIFSMSMWYKIQPNYEVPLWKQNRNYFLIIIYLRLSVSLYFIIINCFILWLNVNYFIDSVNLDYIGTLHLHIIFFFRNLLIIITNIKVFLFICKYDGFFLLFNLLLLSDKNAYECKSR